MPTFRSLDDADVKGKRVLLRVDLNVPMQDGKVTDSQPASTRLRRPSPNSRTRAARSSCCRISAGRKVAPIRNIRCGRWFSRGCQRSSAAGCLRRRLRRPESERAIAAMKNGDILCLENTRFHPGEEKNDKELGETIGGARRHLCRRRLFGGPSRACRQRGDRHRFRITGLSGPRHAGRTRCARTRLRQAATSGAAIVGGAKISTKLDLLGNLLSPKSTC
jgi:phosphoglycerate kinase